jgi:hypothetical protein
MFYLSIQCVYTIKILGAVMEENKNSTKMLGKKNALKRGGSTDVLTARVTPAEKERWKAAAEHAKNNEIQGINGLTDLVVIACNEKADEILKKM